ncbi:MAG: hypothetical protein ACJAS1_004295 [Oleiphilaceae bacterium]|jgi:hypothetical protein
MIALCSLSMVFSASEKDRFQIADAHEVYFCGIEVESVA